MLEVLAAALVQLPAANVDTVRAVHRSAGPLLRESVAAARVRAFADERGTVRSCSVLAFAGTEQSADVLCRAFRGKKVKPARDTDRSRVSGFLEATIVVTPNTRTPAPTMPEVPPDARLSVEHLPDDTTSPFLLAIGLVVDERGVIAACAPLMTEHADLAEQACQSVDGKTFAVVRDADGAPVRYVRSYSVEFAEPPPGA